MRLYEGYITAGPLIRNRARSVRFVMRGNRRVVITKKAMTSDTLTPINSTANWVRI